MPCRLYPIAYPSSVEGRTWKEPVDSAHVTYRLAFPAAAFLERNGLLSFGGGPA